MEIPVRAGIAWKTGGRLRIGVTVGPIRFSAHGVLRYIAGTGLLASLTHDRSGRQSELSLSGRLAGVSARLSGLSSLSRAFGYLFRHTSPYRLTAHIHLSLTDAAHTASLCGILRSSLNALHAVRPALPLDASVTADFRSMQTQLDLCGILSCRLGHIMAAALIGGRDYLSGRIRSWITDNRSKAS